MTLTIQDLGALGEFLGSIAVLATLVYLALQTRQNTMAIGAELDAARLSTLLDFITMPATSSELQEALSEDLVDEEPAGQQRRLVYWAAQQSMWQWTFVHARRGLIPTWNEAGVASIVAGEFSRFRSYGQSWDRMKPNLLPEFVAWVEEQRSKAA